MLFRSTCTTGASTSGQCVISGLNWGTYWLVETSAPTGYYGAAPRTVTITSSNRDITTNPIVDPIRFKVITFVCDNENNLVAGDVTYTVGTTPTNWDTDTSLSDDPGTQATIESGICGADTGYVYTPRGDVTTAITVP